MDIGYATSIVAGRLATLDTRSMTMPELTIEARRILDTLLKEAD